MKKQIFFAGYFLLILSLFPASSKASHLWGADITWKRTGTDTFLVYLTVYRDCEGIPLTDQSVTIFDCKGRTVSNIARSKRIYGADVTPVCKSSCTRCGKVLNSSPGNTSCKFQYGIEKFVYEN